MKKQQQVVVQATDFATIDSDVLKRLWAELPTYKRIIAKTNNGENIYGTYIKAPDLLRRLQEVYGLNYEIHMTPQIVSTPDGENVLYIVQCAISVVAQDGTHTTVSDFGSAMLVRKGWVNENAPKAAATDAFKRAIRWLGIGMFQYEGDEPEIMRNSETYKRSSGSSSQRKTERNFTEEFTELMVSSPDRVEKVVATAFELGLADPDQNNEEVFQTLMKRFNVSAKQLLWLLKDKKTGQEWLEAHKRGVSPREFLNGVFQR